MKNAKNFIWNMIPKILQYGTSLVTSIILARYLTPSDYGVVALANVFFVILNVFVNDGLGNGLIQRKESDSLDFSSVFVCNFLLSIGIYILIFFAATSIAYFCGQGKLLISVIRVLSLRVIVSSILSIQYAYVARNLLFKKRAMPSIVSSLMSGGIGIILVVYGAGVWGLVIQYISMTVIESFGLALVLRWMPGLKFSAQRLKPIISFSWKILVESLISNLTVQVRSILIGKKYSSASLGLYTKGQQFPDAISNCLCVPLNSVLFPMIANIKDSLDESLELLSKVVRTATYFLLPCFFFLCCTANEWVVILMTEKWIEIVPFVWIFSITHIFDIANYTKNAALNGIGKSKTFMLTNGIIKGIDIIILRICMEFGTEAIALSTTGTNFILFVIVSINAKRYLNYEFKRQWQDVAPAVVLCLIATIMSMFADMIQINGIFLEFLLKTFIFWTTYILLSFLTKQNELTEVRSLIKKYKSNKK